MSGARTFASDAEAIAFARRVSKKIHPSKKWQPLVRMDGAQELPTHRDAESKEHWQNDLYLCALFRFESGWILDGGPWAKIGISCHDGQPRHDWREFQRIKNDLVGEDWEAVELYPSERRLIDPSNYFLLWCAPRIPVGMNGVRAIMGAVDCLAPQRAWARGDEPPELAMERKR